MTMFSKTTEVVKQRVKGMKMISKTILVVKQLV